MQKCKAVSYWQIPRTRSGAADAGFRYQLSKRGCRRGNGAHFGRCQHLLRCFCFSLGQTAASKTSGAAWGGRGPREQLPAEKQPPTGCSRAAQLALAGLEHGDSTALKTPITFLISSLFQNVVVAYFLAKTGGGGWRPAGVARDGCLASAPPSPGCLHLQHLQLLRHPPQGHHPSILPNSDFFFIVAFFGHGRGRGSLIEAAACFLPPAPLCRAASVAAPSRAPCDFWHPHHAALCCLQLLGFPSESDALRITVSLCMYKSGGEPVL